MLAAHQEPRRRHHVRVAPRARARTSVSACVAGLTPRPPLARPARRRAELQGVFEKYGLVKDVHLPLDHVNKRPRGFAFVEFTATEDAALAMREMDHRVVNGRSVGSGRRGGGGAQGGLPHASAGASASPCSGAGPSLGASRTRTAARPSASVRTRTASASASAGARLRGRARCERGRRRRARRTPPLPLPLLPQRSALQRLGSVVRARSHTHALACSRTRAC